MDITGAGATFPYPIYAKWAEAYKAKSGVGMNYQSIGSGGGIKQIKAKTVDFGASDMPLKAEELEKDGLTQFPAIMGGVVPVVNIPGIKPGQLKVTGQILADNTAMLAFIRHMGFSVRRMPDDPEVMESKLELAVEAGLADRLVPA